MNVTFAPRGILQIDDARITFRNFAGLGDKYTRDGDRNFTLIIPNEEIANKLMNDKNKYGVGWNVKIKPPRDVDDQPFMYMKVRVKFSDYGPNVYLVSGNNSRRLNEETISMLDKIHIQSVNLDIRPYDGPDGIDGPFRAAYLKGMEVFQELDRFDRQYAEEEYPSEPPF